ncbi:MAG: SPOR domain-containing protein [Bacteroidales bacterium]|nr:SPOR domain-containing protein [Bacteroidales bacterium]
MNGLYKYSVGNFSTKEEAAAQLPALKKKFPGAFIIAVD